MLGRVSEEIEVNVPASEAWKLYGSLQLAKIVGEGLPSVVTKVDVLQGDGGPGTILQLFFPPGTEGPTSCKEKFTVVDDEKRVKETEALEGGHLDLGFTLFRIRFEVLEKEGIQNQCITRATIEYEAKEGDAAAEAWKLYGSLHLARIASEALPHTISKIDVVQGDGAAGTVLELFFPPGTVGMVSYKEKFTVVDDEKRVKEAEVVEGGYLDLGFSLYRVRFEIIEKEGSENECCITRSTIEYEVKEEAAPNAAALVSIQPLVDIMEAAAKYLVQNYKLITN